MPQYGFGSGSLFGISQVGGSTPVKFGALQEVSIEVSFSAKELIGGYQYPLAVGRSKAKITGKAKMAQLRTDVFNSLFFGLAAASYKINTVVEESVLVESGGVYGTATVAKAGTFVLDLGVVSSALLLPLVRTPSILPSTGEYYTSFGSPGVYRLNSDEVGERLLISYTYQDLAVPDHTMRVTNRPIGESPTFMVTLNNATQGKDLTLTLNRCLSTKLSLPIKLEDFIIPEFDFEVMTSDATNLLGELSLAE
jgi:hypothetical protein